MSTSRFFFQGSSGTPKTAETLLRRKKSPRLLRRLLSRAAGTTVALKQRDRKKKLALLVPRGALLSIVLEAWAHSNLARQRKHPVKAHAQLVHWANLLSGRVSLGLSRENAKVLGESRVLLDLLLVQLLDAIF